MLYAHCQSRRLGDKVAIISHQCNAMQGKPSVCKTRRREPGNSYTRVEWSCSTPGRRDMPKYSTGFLCPAAHTVILNDREDYGPPGDWPGSSEQTCAKTLIPGCRQRPLHFDNSGCQQHPSRVRNIHFPELLPRSSYLFFSATSFNPFLTARAGP